MQRTILNGLGVLAVLSLLITVFSFPALAAPQHKAPSKTTKPAISLSQRQAPSAKQPLLKREMKGSANNATKAASGKKPVMKNAVKPAAKAAKGDRDQDKKVQRATKETRRAHLRRLHHRRHRASKAIRAKHSSKALVKSSGKSQNTKPQNGKSTNGKSMNGKSASGKSTNGKSSGKPRSSTFRPQWNSADTAKPGMDRMTPNALRRMAYPVHTVK